MSPNEDSLAGWVIYPTTGTGGYLGRPSPDGTLLSPAYAVHGQFYDQLVPPALVGGEPQVQKQLKVVLNFVCGLASLTRISAPIGMPLPIEELSHHDRKSLARMVLAMEELRGAIIAQQNGLNQ
jgi:hypothetical protein